MPPNKRRTKPGNVEHHGRITTHRDDATLPRATPPSPMSAATRRSTERDAPAASSRYTPPRKSVRYRPDWHKIVGALILVLGIAVIVLNDVMLLGASRSLLPGGHNELYLILGIVIAGYSTWWFGWFDREH